MLTGDKIKALRTRARLTQQELADRVGVSRTAISQWEGGAYLPERENLISLGEALGVSTAYLIGETDNPERAEIGYTSETSFINNAQGAVRYQTEAAQDLDRLIRELASKNPDLIIRLRSTAQSLDELSDDAKQAIADGLKYVLGLAELDELPRLKKDSGKGLI